MDLHPLKMRTTCVMEDAGLYEHMRLALERGLPLIAEHHEHNGNAVLVGSGPSVTGQIEAIRKHRGDGDAIVAIKDAHDWLIGEGVVPDYAIAIDPQEERWNCFTRKHKDVRYLIASQCHPRMFEHLSGMEVYLWHLYIRKGQTYPPNSILVTGGTTTGLRAITLFYSMGFRWFDLYGYDCCMQGDLLRFNGTGDTAKRCDVIVGGKRFITTPAMASQANEFQNLYLSMPDVQIASHGEGIITTILEERAKATVPPDVSFVHGGDESVASYRYRALIPAQRLGWGMNDLRARTLVYVKPQLWEFPKAKEAKAAGHRIVVDFCDDHFATRPHYLVFLGIADAVTCPTAMMAAAIMATGYTRDITVIPDPYEYPEEAPHCYGGKLLWFGHASNIDGLMRVAPLLGKCAVVSNVPGAIPWSEAEMLRQFKIADIVILPATAPHKSANRAVEAIRQGCYVVAEPHPALNEIPGIWIGDIHEGVAWAEKNPGEARVHTGIAQEYVRERYAPATIAAKWRTLVEMMVVTKLEAA